MQFFSKSFTHFANLNSLDIENNMLQKHSQKSLSLYRFCSKHVSVWCQKKDVCTAPFLDGQELHSWSTLKANLCIFLCISVRKFYLVRKDCIISLTGLTVLGLVKFVAIFHFNWNFWKLNYFSEFQYLYLQY